MLKDSLKSSNTSFRAYKGTVDAPKLLLSKSLLNRIYNYYSEFVAFAYMTCDFTFSHF